MQTLTIYIPEQDNVHDMMLLLAKLDQGYWTTKQGGYTADYGVGGFLN